MKLRRIGVAEGKTDVSVVIPAHNAEKYISNCIESLLTQTLKTVEIFVVDDGSTDSTREIVSEYQNRDARVKLIQQPKQNAGVARNNGLKNARGKYIVFLDADDFFEPELLEKAYTTAEKRNAQIVLFDYYVYDDITGKKVKKQTSNRPKGVFSAHDLGERLFQVCRVVPWNKFYLKSFIDENHLMFQDIEKSNDVRFAICSVSSAQRMVFLKDCLVNFRVRNANSLQGRVNSKMECSILSRAATKQELIKRGLYSGEIKKSYYNTCKELCEIFKRITDTDALCRYYNVLKLNLIPDLFDSSNNFEDSEIMNLVFQSKAVEDFIFQLYQRTREESVSKSSIDYRLGHLLLKLPRKVKHKGESIR